MNVTNVHELHKQNMNMFYKKIFLDKISTHICWIRYKSGDFIYERPYKMASSSPNMGLLIASNNIELVDCVTNIPRVMNFQEVVSFNLKENVPNEEIEKDIVELRSKYSNFKFLKGRKLQDLVFVVDNRESKAQKTLILKLLDLMQKDEVYDYFGLKNNNEDALVCLRESWQNLIVQKFNETIASLDEEMKNATDQSVKDELESIKAILQSVPVESKEELSKRNTWADITSYWPILLLPKPEEYSL